MRIISGKYKGLRLVGFNEDHIRPTSDRVKESLFNILQDIEGCQVLDLFSGTGNLGIEALSREASHVTFVELSKRSLQVLKRNLETVKITSQQADIIQKDVFSFLKSNREKNYDLILVDPPFTEKIAHEVMTALSESTVWAPHTIIVIESSSRERIEERYGQIIRYKHREFGDKILSFFTKEDISENKKDHE